MATVTSELVHNPEIDGPIQGLYKKVRGYLPEVENQTIERLENRINGVIEGCDKVVATASTKLKKGVVDIKAVRNYANGLTQRVLNEIEDRLNTYINKLEDQEAPSSEPVVVRKAEPETRLNRLVRKSRKLNQLVVKRVASELGRFAATALTLDYPQLLLTASGNLWLEARVISTVVQDLVGEWIDDQLRALKVNFRRTKDGFIFNVKRCTDAEFMKQSIITRATDLKESAFKVVDGCLRIKLDQATLLKNWGLLKDLVKESVSQVCDKPKQMIATVRTDSRNLYEKVVRSYRVQKILASRPKVEALPEAAH